MAATLAPRRDCRRWTAAMAEIPSPLRPHNRRSDEDDVVEAEGPRSHELAEVRWRGARRPRLATRAAV